MKTAEIIQEKLSMGIYPKVEVNFEYFGNDKRKICFSGNVIDFEMDYCKVDIEPYGKAITHLSTIKLL